MIVIGLALLGALIGGTTAYRRRGNGKDIAQYAAGYAIAFALLGMIVTVFLHRAMV
ncbi:MAG: apolipoprotein acyltransferase [Pseudomonadota bacterium]